MCNLHPRQNQQVVLKGSRAVVVRVRLWTYYTLICAIMRRRIQEQIRRTIPTIYVVRGLEPSCGKGYGSGAVPPHESQAGAHVYRLLVARIGAKPPRA